MKQEDHSSSGCGIRNHDETLIESSELPELMAGDNNDAEIAEIVDVISNDSSLLPMDIMAAYHDESNGSHHQQRKSKLAKRQKLEVVLPKLNYNLICDRLVGTLHMPLQTPKMGRDKKDTRTNCGICGAKTTIKCAHCAVGMCIADRDGRNCWREFHTRDILEYKQQPKADRKERSRHNGMSLSVSDACVLRDNLQLDVLAPLSNGSSSLLSNAIGLE